MNRALTFALGCVTGAATYHYVIVNHRDKVADSLDRLSHVIEESKSKWDEAAEAAAATTAPKSDEDESDTDEDDVPRVSE